MSPASTLPMDFRLPGAQTVTRASLGRFRKLIEACPVDEDTQLSSPAYFVHTCRKGLAVAGEPDRFAVIGRHPNLADRLLVFPQPGRLDIDFLAQVCAALPRPANGIQICRIKRADRDTVTANTRFEYLDELVLDWRYPCAFLSCARLVDPRGPELAQFRQKLGRLDAARLRMADVAADDLEGDVMALVQDWARSVSEQKKFSIDNLVEPNRSGFDLCFVPELNVEGRLVCHGDMPIGFFTYEHPAREGVLNTLTMCVARDVPGASEWAHVMEARAGLANGAETLNINGAETETLHRFRKKMAPVKLLDIDSYEFTG